MNIGNSQGNVAVPAAVKTEYSSNPAALPEPKEKTQESFGSTLNRMAGVQDKKSLYNDSAKNALTKESYLKMMMEQLKYQDPFNPVKNEQFTQNMAMMSQLEQQMNMNQTLDKMLAQGNNMQIAALQLVGKTIQADHAAIYHEKDKFTNIQFKLPQDAKDLNVEIVGAQGNVLKTITMGQQNVGEISTKWDGLLEDGQQVPTGKYSYQVKAVAMDGQEITIPSKIEGRVTGVTNVQGVTFLLVGDQKVALNEIEVIKDSSAPSNTPAPGVAAFVNAAAKQVPGGEGVIAPADGDKDTAGTKVATKIEVDPQVEEEMTEEKTPLEKERLNDLMQMMFR